MACTNNKHWSGKRMKLFQLWPSRVAVSEYAVISMSPFMHEFAFSLCRPHTLTKAKKKKDALKFHIVQERTKWDVCHTNAIICDQKFRLASSSHGLLKWCYSGGPFHYYCYPLCINSNIPSIWYRAALEGYMRASYFS